MPLYRTQCKACGRFEDIFRTIANRNCFAPCPCGGETERIIQAPAVVGEIEPFVSPASGRVITSRAERRADMRAHGYIDLEPGAQKQVEANRKHRQEQAFKPIADTVDKIVTELNSSGKLENLSA